MTREEFITGLRVAADFFEAHPNVEAPWDLQTINVFAHTKEDLLARAKAIGGQWEKEGMGDYFTLRRAIGCFSYEINIQRSKVCQRIVKGSRVETKTVEDVEWVCADAVLHEVDA